MESRRRSRRLSRRAVATATAIVLAAGAVYAVVAIRHHGQEQNAVVPSAPVTATTTIKRTDLSESQTLPGTLGFGKPRTVTGTEDGVITGLPHSGQSTERGKPLYWVDDQPVTVFYGDVPFFRPLTEPGQSGHDVTVLVENLKALGYDIGDTPAAAPRPRYGSRSSDPGTQLTTGALDALKRWQHDTGRQATGKLDPDQFAVLQVPSRVNSVTAQLGDKASEEVLTLTSKQKGVTVKVGATAADAIGKGESVSIVLPDTKAVPGKVVSVSTTVESEEGTEDSDKVATLLVTVAPADPTDIAKIDAAAVQVVFTGQSRKDILVVPVGALLALSEGGYALQYPGGRLEGVKTGMFAKGLVEISGGAVKEGDRVVTAS